MANLGPGTNPIPPPPSTGETQGGSSKFSISLEGRIGLGILVLTLGAYAQVTGFQFISLDDPLYIANNPTILGGMSWKSLWYAFSTGDDGSYLPLVWLSHAACVSLFKTWPGGHHLVNLLLHAANAILLFFFLNKLTKAPWPSAGVAFLFALHPLHVESVAWVAERKDVLSTLFWILTLWAYVHYTERPSLPRYGGMAGLFVLGLLSKSMLVTVPLTLLLFDAWPLQRLKWTGSTLLVRAKGLWALIVEKLPLFALSLGTSVVTFSIQKSSGATDAQAILPISVRLGNAVITTGKYLHQTFWPVDLSPFYPYPEVIYRWRVAGWAALVLIISVICVLNFRRRPYLVVGWFWYLLTLLPVVGIIQVGSQAHADRYTYVPLIGIFVMLCWLAEEVVLHWRLPRMVVIATLGSLLGAVFTLTAAQTSIWRDSETLWTRALDRNPRNFLAQQHLGEIYIKEKRFQEACAVYSKATEYLQSYSMYIKLGDLLEMMGSDAQALATFQAARGCHVESGRLWASHPPIVDQRIGSTLTRLGRYEEAAPFVLRVLKASGLGSGAVDPAELLASSIDWATILRVRNRLPEALQVLESVMQESPGSERARLELGLLYCQMGRREEALRQMAMVSERPSLQPQLLYALGVALTKLGRYTEARRSFERIIAADPHSPLVQKGILELERAQRSNP